MRAALILVAVLLPSAALAEQERPPRLWELDAGGGVLVYGPKQHQAGGAMPSISGRRRWQLGERVDVALGVRVGAFGFGDEPRWIGVLAGPTAAVGVRPWRWFGASLEVDAAFGRIPVCNPWGLCLRFVGAFPAARLSLAWYSDGAIALGASAAVRVVQSLAWSGPAGELGAVGRVAF